LGCDGWINGSVDSNASGALNHIGMGWHGDIYTQKLVATNSVPWGDTEVSFDNTNTTVITANEVTSNAFVKTGGTSSQFLKADGSVDSNTYLPIVNGTVSVSDGDMDIFSGGQQGDFITAFNAKVG